MKKIIDVCTRVEGHGAVNILLENQNETISLVEFKIDAYRGFENILLRKKLFDIPKISSRICGLCHASQAIVSCKAIESMYDIEISEQSMLLRRLLMIGELIKSHSMHFFFQFFPDLLVIFDILKKVPSLYQLTKFNPQLSTNMYELIKIGNDMDKFFGGRNIHPITTVPGGVVYTPLRKNLLIARKYLQKVMGNLEWVIEKFIELFSNKNPPNYFELPNPTYFGLHNYGNYDRYTGILGIKQHNSNIVNFIQKEYIKYFNKDPELRGINFFKHKNILVGPLARFNIIENYGVEDVYTYIDYFDNSWKNNILFANFIKLIEMYIEASQGLEILNNSILEKRISLPSLNSIKNTEGIGFVEAPRGMLMHHYHINKNNIIDKVKLYIATEINIPLINEMITSYARKLYEKNDINLVKEKVQTIIRAFDPCISCATH
ncbi:MAG: nickel-dependent hydrogenase large subunit [Promethearchaeota archaeon]